MPLIDVLNRLKITPDMSPDEIAEIFNDANITPDSLSLEPDVSDVTKPTIPVTPERLAVDRPQEPIDLPAGDKPEDVNIKEAAGKPDGRVYPLTDWHRPTVRRSVSNRFGALRRPSEPVDIPAREKLENININLRDTTGQPEDLPVERPRIELEQEDELHLPEEGKPVTEHYVDLDVITKDMIKDAQNTIRPFSEKENTVTVLKDSFEGKSTSGGRYKIFIDPNINDAWIIDNETGDEIYRFPIGTGDITGTRYGKKYFTPTGKGTVVKYIDVGSEVEILPYESKPSEPSVLSLAR